MRVLKALLKTLVETLVFCFPRASISWRLYLLPSAAHYLLVDGIPFFTKHCMPCHLSPLSSPVLFSPIRAPSLSQNVFHAYISTCPIHTFISTCPACAPLDFRSDKYLGRLATGKIVSGVVEVGKPLKCLGRLGAARGGGGAERGGAPQKVAELFVTRGVTRESLGASSAAGAGDIVTVAGVE